MVDAVDLKPQKAGSFELAKGLYDGHDNDLVFFSVT